MHNTITITTTTTTTNNNSSGNDNDNDDIFERTFCLRFEFLLLDLPDMSEGG